MSTIADVKNISPIIKYVGSSSQTEYTYPFPILSKDDIHVSIAGVDLPSANYTVTGVTDENGGKIILNTPTANGEEIIIYRKTEIERTTDYVENGDFLAETVNNDFDRIVLMLQEFSAYYINSDGSVAMKGPLNMGGFQINHVDDGVAETDAVNKRQLDHFLIDEDGILKLVNEIRVIGVQVDDDAKEVNALYVSFRDDYAGHGPSLPSGEDDGTLFYYDGPLYTQGLYINYSHHSDPYTGTWDLVSGVGPQGPQGAQGVQGATGEKGEQGIEGPRGSQGQRGIQGAIGDTGPAGIQGETGATGPQGVQGNVGPEGPEGAQGVQGLQGNKGDTGAQGVQGLQGLQGDSFAIDALGTMAERAVHDNEPQDFTYYATDYSVTANNTPDQLRTVGDGSTTDFLLPFIPDGPQSLSVSLGGVLQGIDMYTVEVVEGPPETYTIKFNEAPIDGMNIIIREFSIATGYGAIFIKRSASNGDWSQAVPFGRGPRGDQGPQGIEGIQGPQGLQGAIGPQGSRGDQGNAGIEGPQGATGNVGPQGQAGPTGDRGPIGVQGADGPIGPQGVQGPQGNKGATGAQGPQGAVGDQGARGDQGQIGPTGSKGDKGDTGDKGPTGSDGADGRSSSGKTYNKSLSQTSVSNTTFISKLFDTVRVNVSKPYARQVKLSGLFSYGTGGSSSTYSVGVQAYAVYGGVTIYSDVVYYNHSSEIKEVEPIYLDIPTNTTGDIEIYFRVRLSNGTGSGAGTLRGNSDNLFLAELFPLSTELT